MTVAFIVLVAASAPVEQCTGTEYLLVQTEVIAKEIGLTDEQKRQLKPLIQEDAKAFAALHKDFMEKVAKESEEVAQIKLSDESEDDLGRLAEVRWLKLKAALKTDQAVRLRQIHIQQADAEALFLPDVEEALSLTKSQKDQLEAIRLEFRAKMRLKGSGPSLDERIREVRTQRNLAAFGVLTADQRTKFESLKGKPFDLKKLTLTAW